jgi:vacuolar-type H+-ATPase subunit D/Vma8
MMSLKMRKVSSSFKYETKQGLKLFKLIVIDYSALNKQLDDLNSALDILEQKNDNITVQLLELLQNSREVRKNLADEREQAQSNE